MNVLHLTVWAKDKMGLLYDAINSVSINRMLLILLHRTATLSILKESIREHRIVININTFKMIDIWFL